MSLQPNPYPPSADPRLRPLEHHRPQILRFRPNQVFFGLFMPTQSWNNWPTTAANGTEWTYDYNRSAAVLAEKKGLHFLLPPARWKGTPGDEIDFRGVSLDPITFAAAISEATTRIAIAVTIHTNVIHPVVGAKICADLDQISNGRLVLNIVSGWNEDEFNSMSIPFLPGRRDRYRYTREWLEIVRSLWESGRCTYKGDFFSVNDAASRPLPAQKPRPVIVNAGQSAAGLNFAAEQADFLFSRSERADRWREVSATVGRSVGYVALHRVLVRRNQAEAESLARDIFDKCDIGALRNTRISSGASTPEDADAWLANADNRYRALFEEAFIGSPDTVSEKLAELILRVRPNGICLTLYDHLPELELFGDEVLPRLDRILKKSGLEVAPAT